MDTHAADMPTGWVERLIDLGDAECAALPAGGSAALPRTPMEEELPAMWLHEPQPITADAVPRARCLPDGSWSCGRPVERGKPRAPSCTLNASSPPTCKSLWR